MTPETYYLSAITGILLAGFVILGWRRLFPVILFCIAPLGIDTLSAQSGPVDEDNDVPTLEEIRDQIIAQKNMMYEFFSGMSSGELTAINTNTEDISNALHDGGGSATDKLNAIRTFQSQISQNTDGIEIRQDQQTPLLQDITNNTGDIVPWLTLVKTNTDYNQYLGDVKNNTADISNYSEDSLTELQDISNNVIPGLINPASVPYLSDTNSWLNGIFNTTTATNNSVGSLSSQLDTDNDVPAIQSLESLLSGYGQWDTDNDVDAIQDVEAAVDALRNSNSANFASTNTLLTSMKSILEDINSDRSAPVVPEIPTYEDPPAPPPLLTFADANQGTVADQTIKQFAQKYSSADYGLQNKFNPDITLTVSQTAKPLTIPVLSLPTTQFASGFSGMNTELATKFTQHLATLSPIVKPIFTGYLCFIMFLFTFKEARSALTS